jgi:adenine-specific DNA methylase
MIEKHFDISLIAGMALKEKQIQQNYRPIIGVHKWFARRPGTLFRGLLLSEFSDRPLSQAFFSANDFPGKKVADPFMGGGTPLIEANRIGCDVFGFDINPMSAWIVNEEICHLDLSAYREAVAGLLGGLDAQIGDLYRTNCPRYGDVAVPVKYFLWVKVLACASCAGDVDLFPGYLLADSTRHPKNVLICPDCGELNEVAELSVPGRCSSCAAVLCLDGPAKRSRCRCRHCGHQNTYPDAAQGIPRHRLFAIEYFNPARKKEHPGRFFKRPDAQDLARADQASALGKLAPWQFIPDDLIPRGDETNRLHRWGYRAYRDLFNSRQLLGLELGARSIAECSDQRVRHALATNLSDLLRYQNMLCRYDTMALKSLDVFSVHGFPVGLVQCESNLLGVAGLRGEAVGSGGWRNIAEKYAKAKGYCDAPFETVSRAGRKQVISIPDEWIGESRTGYRQRKVSIQCLSSEEARLQAKTLDAVFTDPPYFGNVQYGELMDFCYVWLRRLVGHDFEEFRGLSARKAGELTGNETQGRGLAYFAAGLGDIYRTMAVALKPGAPLAFTFHHNRLEAYWAVGVAILDAGLVCTAALPCPAEMGGSIHIHGTDSSIVDTVFVCRSTGVVSRRTLAEDEGHLVELVANDLERLKEGGVKPSRGDIRCIVFGHLTRMGIWALREAWQHELEPAQRLARFAKALTPFGDPDRIVERLRGAEPREFELAQERAPYGGLDEISF